MSDDPLLPRRVFAAAASFAVLENSVTHPINRAPTHPNTAPCRWIPHLHEPVEQARSGSDRRAAPYNPHNGLWARFSPIRFLLTGAAPNMGAQHASSVRRAAKQKTLLIARSKQAVRPAIGTESALFIRNRQDLTRVLVSYRTFSQRWALRPIEENGGGPGVRMAKPNHSLQE